MAKIDYFFHDKVLYISFSGQWSLQEPVADYSDLLKLLDDGKSGSEVSFISKEVENWDNSLLLCCRELLQHCKDKQMDFNLLDKGLYNLIHLSSGPILAQSKQRKVGFFESIGRKVVEWQEAVVDVLAFMGMFFGSVNRFFLGKCKYDKSELWQVTRQCGMDALPIVSLTSLLLGLIFAFIGSVQLKMFGAELYVAGGVTLTMVRVMSPVLTGIILSGRTGAAFAALIGTMQVNEEIDALKSFAIDPMDFIVFPRVFALAIMTPLLSLYSILLGLFGGFLVGVFMLGISPMAYYENTIAFFYLKHLWIGLFHAFIFGIIIALTGCYQGIHCGRSAEDVGQVTTSAVVISIVGIIVATSIITVVTTIVPI